MNNLMKFRNYAIMLTILSLLFVSCDDENNDIPEDKTPTVFQADNNWYEDSLIPGQELWYKVVAGETFTTLFVEWAELDNHGQDRNYDADIKVSAYQLDGVTPYFEDEDNGYKDQNEELTLSVEKEVLLKVVLNDESKPGTFALRSTGTGAVNIEYIKLNVGDEWYEATITDGEIVGFNVDCTGATKVQVVWAEDGSPEVGYTAEIMGSVLYKDGETPYITIDKGDDFLNKNKSETGNPKSVVVDAEEQNIKVHFSVNSNPGTFAFKVVSIIE